MGKPFGRRWEIDSFVGLFGGEKGLKIDQKAKIISKNHQKSLKAFKTYKGQARNLQMFCSVKSYNCSK
jgi:hypothetical protein